MTRAKKLFAAFAVVVVIAWCYAVLGPKEHQWFAFLAAGSLSSLGFLIVLVSVAMGKPLVPPRDHSQNDDLHY